MKVAVVGSRGFADWHLLSDTLNAVREQEPIDLIVSGGAKGADKMGEQWAEQNNIPTKIFKPDWEKHGKAAGFIRNEQIVRESDVVVAFWDGESRGTSNSIGWAKKLGKQLLVVEF